MEVEEEEEEPCYILNIPNELQLMIFDKMEPADKISFGKTSRKCRAIWKESKSLFDGIAWNYNKFEESILLSFNDSYPFEGNRQSVECHENRIVFGEKDTYFSQRNNFKRGLEFAKWKFVKTLEKYQNTVKSITIDGECSANLRNITSFPSLRYLILRDCPNIVREVLSKSVNALEYLEIDEWNNNYADCPEIYRVSEYLSIFFELTREQFHRLSAKRIEMEIGDLKAEDIFEFIKSWQNGRRNLESCKWALGYLDAPKFFGFFNTQVINRYKRITIRGPGETLAQIVFRKKTILIFEVLDDLEIIDADGAEGSDTNVDYREYSYDTEDDFDD
ncbi:unnamed protein product [Caenorhabditis angaria]|uniref:F-box domain-containing protein n=1 Tax=Caenorhabditis angaria TaxID=860376 RepID=A0A9P1ITP3_9PELO|nr:unnamed protein product [Caenorhabditis angaria]